VNARHIPLNNPSARSFAMQIVREAPAGHVVIVRELTRSIEANAKLHAMLTDISRQATYHGCKRSVEFWKGLFVSGWQIATGQKQEIVPGIEGEFINIRESTTTLSPKRISDLIEYIYAWATENGVRFRAQEYEL
jgi:hypothetical protein